MDRRSCKPVYRELRLRNGYGSFSNGQSDNFLLRRPSPHQAVFPRRRSVHQCNPISACRSLLLTVTDYARNGAGSRLRRAREDRATTKEST